MYRLTRLNNLRTLFTAAATTASAAHPKQLPRRSPPARSIPLTRSFSHAGEGSRISGQDDEAPSINDIRNTLERKVLPPELSRSVVTLRCESSAHGGVCDVYVVGTLNGSTESRQEVEAVIEFLKPQVVFLELCSNCKQILSPQVASKPCSEFFVVREEAMKHGDRPAQITVRRAWAKMPLWHKTKFLQSLLNHAVRLKAMKDSKALAETYGVPVLTETNDVDVMALAIEDMKEKIPALMETIVHERDQYLSASILKVARKHNSVVAVVGKAHLPGIRKNWKQPVEVEQLLSMPSENNRITATIIVASIGGTAAWVAIVSGVAFIFGIIYLSIQI